MRDSRPQLLDALFDDDAAAEKGSLHNIQQRAIALLKLNRAVKGLLPSQLHPWCRVANFRQGILVLETANASWLMRLRYEQSSLLSALRAQILPSLSSIDIRINPTLMAKGHHQMQDSVKISKNVPLRYLSQESAEHLRRVAARSPEKLKRKLERLASLAGERANATSRNK